MATILIWMAPEPSHILPTIKLARDLQLLSHKVIYLATGSMHDQLSRLGFHCRRFLDGILDKSTNDGLFTTTSSSVEWRGMLLGIFGGDAAAADRAITRNIEEVANAVGADLVLVDGLMHYLHDIFGESTTRSAWQVGFVQTHLPLVFLERNRVRTQRLLSRVHRTIILCPKEIELSNYGNGAGYYTEPCIHLDRDEIQFPWEWLEPGSKLVYCSLGSQSREYSPAPQVLGSILETAKRMPHYQFVISAGPYYQELYTAGLSSNCLVLPVVPQTSLLKKAAAMILQGGLGSIKECIYFGVPMLILPFQNDQPVNALRIQRHGLGFSMPPDKATSSGIDDALTRLVEDQSIDSRIRKMQAVFYEREQKNIAAAICEQFLHATTPSWALAGC